MICRATLAATVFVLSLSPADAQLTPEPRLGSRIPVAPEEFPVDQTREVMQAFAKCVVKKFPELTHQIVLDAWKITADDRYLKAADPHCLASATSSQFRVVQLRMGPASFRYAVADELIERNLNLFDPANIAFAAPLPKPSLDPADYVPKAGDRRRRFKPEDYERARQRDQAAVGVAVFGECVVRANPRGARDLLRTKVNSDAELQALRAMMPSFSACLDRGHTLKTERTTLRGAVALNYYRLAYAPRLSRGQTGTSG